MTNTGYTSKTGKGKEHPVTARILRGLDLYSTREAEIVDLGDGFVLVPSCAGEHTYLVDSERETCECPDHERTHTTCKPLVAAIIHRAKEGPVSSCSCHPGFRICNEASALYEVVEAAHQEYVRIVREEPGNGAGIGAALEAHVVARRTYDAHVYARVA